MTLSLLAAGVVMIACILCNKLSNKIGLPSLLIFIALGMIFGSDGLLKIPFSNYSFAQDICSIALIFIMFYGGFGMRWSTAKPIASRAILLSSLGVILTAGLTGVFCHFVLGFTWLEGLLLGSILGSTDAASVFSILKSKKLNLKYGTAPLLEMESGSNDPCAYMLTVILLSVMEGTSSAGSLIWMTIAQVLFGLLGGFVLARVAAWFYQRFNFSDSGFDTIFVFAVSILGYAVPSFIGGNGYLSVYIMGILLGNGVMQDRKNLINFFDAFTGMMEMLLFFLLGLISFPSQLPAVLLPAIAIALFMTFIGRPFVVTFLLKPFKARWQQIGLISWSGLRGAASIVFSIMAVVSAAHMENDIFHITFCVVLISIALQGSLLPFMARRMQMIDEHENVLKTFTSYSDETDVQFFRVEIDTNHPWKNHTVQQLRLIPNMLLVLILRNGENIVPKGDTRLCEGDALIVSAEGYEDKDNILLRESVLDNTSPWCGKTLSEITFRQNTIVVLVKREQTTIIPDGSTLLLPGDRLVLYSQKKKAPQAQKK